MNSTTLPKNNFINACCTVSNSTIYKDASKLFENKEADLPSFLLAAYQHFQLNYPRFYKMDNLSKLGWLASEILLNSSFKKENYNNEDIGVILANRNSSLDNDIRYFHSIKDFPSPSLFVYTLPNIVIGEIAIRHHFKGEHAFFIQDQFNASFMHNQVNYLLNNSLLKACICGWVEVLGEEYKAVLFLVEKYAGDKETVLCSVENMNTLFDHI